MKLTLPSASFIDRVPDVVAVRCNFCSKQRPAFRAHRITAAQVICDHCLEWHMHAVDFLSGSAPAGCQDCGSTWAMLRDLSPTDEVRLYVVPKDGIYQLLCATCVQRYLPKRADLYRGTQFGKDTLNL